MTALKQYIRLESLGNWQAAPEAALREVIVSFGKSTLMLRDGSDAPLAHWALSATHIVASDAAGTTYSPDPEAKETLLIADRDMIEAIAQVTAAGLRRRALPRRRNRLVAVLVVLAVAGLLVALGPETLKTYTASRMSLAGQQNIAMSMLGVIERERGAACSSSQAGVVFQRLIGRILPGENLMVTVIPLAGAATASLPGGVILLDPRTIERAADPEELAGWIVLEALRAGRAPPMAVMLRSGSLRATVELLASGRVDPLLVRQAAGRVGLPDEEGFSGLEEGVLEALAAAGLPSLPFATALAREGASIERIKRLRAGNTVAVGTAFEPALADQNWVLLKGICGR